MATMDCKLVVNELMLQQACNLGNLDDVRSLANEGVNLNLWTREGGLLLSAAKHSNWVVLELLINLGADVNVSHNRDNGWKLIHHACRKGWFRVVQLFVDKKLDLDSKGVQLETPLMFAAVFNHKDIVELLVNSGATINCRDVHGRSALHYASKRGRLEIVKYLLEKNMDINDKDNFGETALHLAIAANDHELVYFLIQTGANPNLVDNAGNRAFSLLVDMGYLGAIKLAIEKGAYVDNDDYETLGSQDLFKKQLLNNVEYCSLAICNKYHNKDIPDLYQVQEASDKLPPIGNMQIRDGSGAFVEVKRAVTQAINAKKFCNLTALKPLSLTWMSVNAFVEHIHTIERLKAAAREACRPRRLRIFEYGPPSKKKCV